jgi:uncharacterized protein (DUF1697 family)
MALVVLLRGVNVGGYRTFRPATLANQLKHLDAVNIGAAGTFVIRKKISGTQLRGEFARRLPFNTEILICQGRDIARLTSHDFFADYPSRPDIVRFVSVLSHSPRSAPSTPMSFPATGTWLVRIVARKNRFLVGVYRRQMKAISCLGALDRVFGAPATTRNWNTITAIAKVLEHGATSRSSRTGLR